MRLVFTKRHKVIESLASKSFVREQIFVNASSIS